MGSSCFCPGGLDNAVSVLLPNARIAQKAKDHGMNEILRSQDKEKWWICPHCCDK
jgi:hypothetical protein